MYRTFYICIYFSLKYSRSLLTSNVDYLHSYGIDSAHPGSLWGCSPSPLPPGPVRPLATDAAGTDTALRLSSRQRAPCGRGFTACWSPWAGSGAQAPGRAAWGSGCPSLFPGQGSTCGSAEGGKAQRRSPRSPAAPRRVQVTKHQGCRVPSSLCRRRAGTPPSGLCHLLHPTCHPARAAQLHLQRPRLSRPPAPAHSTELPFPSRPSPTPRFTGPGSVGVAGLEGCGWELGAPSPPDTGTLCGTPHGPRDACEQQLLQAPEPLAAKQPPLPTARHRARPWRSRCPGRRLLLGQPGGPGSGAPATAGAEAPLLTAAEAGGGQGPQASGQGPPRPPRRQAQSDSLESGGPRAASACACACARMWARAGRRAAHRFMDPPLRPAPREPCGLCTWPWCWDRPPGALGSSLAPGPGPGPRRRPRRARRGT